MNNITGLTKSSGFPGFIAINILAFLQRALGPLSLFVVVSGYEPAQKEKKNLLWSKIFSVPPPGAAAVCWLERFLPQDALLDHQHWPDNGPLH
ncbi:hypothetical protein QWY85_11895 [Neolewinella lacunae]|uniref:Uncharacterized protein n=1 Tax=Neolewinella lacunae TaxID=1517758 RepID=A0A923T903_9BACT|nr:hypothetical protein [Neolewinella lacunae]MBC6996190.1 hypothetical protein [Neolewinella lacunae]MDN3635364.1 hypothetical protein [Neolewinella lacunae]